MTFILFFQSAVLLIIAFYGLAAQTSSLLRAYFLTQGFYVVAVFGTRAFVGYDAPLFAQVYMLMTLAMLFFVLWLTVCYAVSHPAPLYLLALGLAFAAVPGGATLLYNLPHNLAGWINEIEGAFLLGCGIVTGMSAIFLHRGERKIATALSFLWLFLGAFRQGYRMHWYQDDWELANVWMPWASTALAMGYVAWQMHVGERFTKQPARSFG
jgi:hypothetical protein